MIPYVEANEPIRSEQLNALITELDDVMKCVYAGKTPLVYAHSGPTGFSFTLSNNVVAFGNKLSWKVIPHIFLGILPADPYYNHATFTAAANALHVFEYDPVLQLAYVDLEPWPLTGSLEAHSRVNDGALYYLCQKNSGIIGERERFRKLDVVDVVLESITGHRFEWKEEWNKFHFLRFHNLDPAQTTVVMPGGFEIVLEPFGIQSVRRAYPAQYAYDVSRQYFWTAISGDLLFWDFIQCNPVCSMLFFHRLLDEMSVSTTPSASPIYAPAIWEDPCVFWDGSAYLHEPINLDTKLRRYRWHAGRMLAVQNATTTCLPKLDFTPTWDQLESGAGINGIRYDTVHSRLEDTGGIGSVDVVAVESNILDGWPKALPQNVSFAPATLSIPAPALKNNNYVISARYWDTGSASWIDVPVVITLYYNFFSATSGAGQESSISSARTTSFSAPVGWQTDIDYINGFLDSRSLPSIGTDGWRVIAYGTRESRLKYDVPADSVSGFCKIKPSGSVYSMELHYGASYLDSGGLWTFSDRGIPVTLTQLGEKLSPYQGFTDLFGQVYHRGHPDLLGAYGLPGGIEFIENRKDPTSSVVRVSGDTTANRTTTLNAPVWERGTPVDRVVENYKAPSWWENNRTDLLAGTLSKEDKQQVVRFLILGIHYNHIAQRLNSIMSIKPMTYDDVIYYGKGTSGISDATWTASVYPPNFYCPTASSGSRAVELGIPIGYAPQNHVTIDDASAYAESMGFRFFSRKLVGLRESFGGGYRETDDKSAGYRTEPWGSPWVGGMSRDINGYLVMPSTFTAYGIDGGPYEVLIRVETAQKNGSIPTGWKMDGNDLMIVTPRGMTNFVANPLTQPKVTEDREVLQEYSLYFNTEFDSADPTGTPVKMIEFDNETFNATDLQGFSQYPIASSTPYPPTDKCPVQIKPLNRFLIVRQ